MAPSAAAAHPAYVDAETGSPGAACEEQATPCATIQQALDLVEAGLPVIVDDSASPYSESVTLDAGRSVIAQDFVGGPEAQWTIDGGASPAVTVAASGAGAISGFDLRGGASAVLAGGPVNITGNSFNSGSGNTAIRISAGASSVSVSRNTVSGYTTGVAVEDTTGPVTLAGDLMVSNTTGLTADNSNLTATNVTLASNGTDVSVADADLALDSSIVEDPIAVTGAVSCAISFSRGPTTSGTACENFQTAADPGYAGAGNFHLAADSAMVDAGNPGASPIPTDIDGDPRVVDGDHVCPPVRDIGADEFVPAGQATDCSPLQPMPEPTIGDNASPDTVIDLGPPARTRKRSARLSFHSTEPGSTFECRLDGASFEPCSSPKTYDKLKRNSHTFAVRATDAAGNADPSPASLAWRVKARKRKH